jgi:hypothetical protein
MHFSLRGYNINSRILSRNIHNIFLQKRHFSPFTNPYSLKQTYSNVRIVCSGIGAAYGMYKGFYWSITTTYFLDETPTRTTNIDTNVKRNAFIIYNIYEGGCIGAVCGFFFPITIIGLGYTWIYYK